MNVIQKLHNTDINICLQEPLKLSIVNPRDKWYVSDFEQYYITVAKLVLS